ncbi:MED7 protein-domain-containing protein [Mrakia frigida]|uniref:mediator complex subunit MED7 n=1 Tax=Mrakia frigida TaxID=29902 RepID=UPI003FCBF942
MDENESDDLALGSTFPLPPLHHAKFTDHNLRLLALLTSARASSSSSSSLPSPSSSSDLKGKQREILKGEEDIPDWDLEVELKEPRVDWIEEKGEYEVFGATYFIPQRIPDVEGMGVKRLIPADTSDPKPHLLTLLHSLLHTNLLLLSALTNPPPLPPQSEEEEQNYQTVAGPYVARMADIGVNMMAGVNALRGVQARATLEQMMTSQLERRREETKEIKRKCSELAQTLATLRQSLPSPPSISMEVDAAPAIPVPPPTTSNRLEPSSELATSEKSRTRIEREQGLWASLDEI